MNYQLLKSILFRFDAETAHNLAMTAIKKGLISAPQKQKPIELFGVNFPNPVGLAAGFDKNAVAINQWKNLGFGFVEVGTVTKHAQPGNPKPRLFRLPQHQAIINRMGFNNNGADAMAKQLESASPGIPVGINLGKSKITPLEEAADDYAYSFKLLKDLGDYFVVNVSSPNTPGLRELQDEDHLIKIFWRLKEIDSSKPLFVKIAPDLTSEAIDALIRVTEEFQLTGIISTNTTIDRSMLPSDPKIDGGLSGAPVFVKSNEVLRTLRANCTPSTVLIGVGGICSPNDAKVKLELGADLIQIYSGWIYNGPDFATKIVEALSD